MDVAGFRPVSRRGRSRLHICEPEIVEQGEEANRSCRAASFRKRDQGRVDTETVRRPSHVDGKAKSGTPAGIKAAKIISSGSLAPDENGTPRHVADASDPCPNCGAN